MGWGSDDSVDDADSMDSGVASIGSPSTSSGGDPSGMAALAAAATAARGGKADVAAANAAISAMDSSVGAGGAIRTNVLDKNFLQKAIKEFETGRPVLTMDDVLDRAVITPFARDAVTVKGMKNGLLGLSKGLNQVELDFGVPKSKLKGTGQPPYAPKSALENFSDRLQNAFSSKPTRSMMVDVTDKNVPMDRGTFSVLDENRALDFVANLLNPLSPIMSIDSRTVAPVQGGPKSTLGTLSTPFGSVTTMSKYGAAPPSAPNDGDNSVFIPPRLGASGKTQSLVPMGTDRYGAAGTAAGMTLNPSMYYTSPFSYSLPALSKSFGLLRF